LKQELRQKEHGNRIILSEAVECKSLSG